MTLTIYHNPKCSTSRKVLQMLRDEGHDPQVVEYLKTPPDRATLENIVRLSGGSVRELLRQRGTPYDELDLGNDKWSESELIGFMVEHPILLNRPVVVTGKGAVLARPPEKALELANG